MGGAGDMGRYARIFVWRWYVGWVARRRALHVAARSFLERASSRESATGPARALSALTGACLKLAAETITLAPQDQDKFDSLIIEGDARPTGCILGAAMVMRLS